MWKMPGYCPGQYANVCVAKLVLFRANMPGDKSGRSNYLACAIKLIVQIAETADQRVSVELINYSQRPFVRNCTCTNYTDNREISRTHTREAGVRCCGKMIITGRITGNRICLIKRRYLLLCAN